MRYSYIAILFSFLFACGSETQQTQLPTTEVKFEPKLKTIGDYDLVAVRITYKPEKVYVGDEVVFESEVTNKGIETIPARSFKVELFLDDKLISYDYGTSELVSGGATTYSKGEGHYHVKPDKPGEYHYKFILDRENTLRETDETNNVIEGTIVVE